MFAFLASGCILHGSCSGVCSCLSPIQNPQGWMFSVTGSLPRSTVCSKVSIFKVLKWCTSWWYVLPKTMRDVRKKGPQYRWWQKSLHEFILLPINHTGKLFLGLFNNQQSCLSEFMHFFYIPTTDLMNHLNISAEEECFCWWKENCCSNSCKSVCLSQWHLTNGLNKRRRAVCPWSLPLLWGLYWEGSAVLCPSTQNGSWPWESMFSLPCKSWGLGLGLRNYQGFLETEYSVLLGSLLCPLSLWLLYPVMVSESKLEWFWLGNPTQKNKVLVSLNHSPGVLIQGVLSFRMPKHLKQRRKMGIKHLKKATTN